MSRVWLAAVAFAFGACAAVERAAVEQRESLLAQAGFEPRPADTADKLAHLAGLKPHTVVAFTKDGRRLYGYADPDGCRCLYVGDEAAYRRYRELVTAPEAAQEAAIAARVDEEDADDAGTDWEYNDGPLWW
jgi:hypothetical protein